MRSIITVLDQSNEKLHRVLPEHPPRVITKSYHSPLITLNAQSGKSLSCCKKSEIPTDLTVVWFLPLIRFISQLIALISRGVGLVSSVNMLRFLARLIREFEFLSVVSLELPFHRGSIFWVQ